MKYDRKIIQTRKRMRKRVNAFENTQERLQKSVKLEIIQKQNFQIKSSNGNLN